MIEVTINGDIHKTEAGQNLAQLLEGLQLDPLKVAVERNLEIVPKTTYQNVTVENGDRLEIVHFIGGGK
nr:sulfur carrier protein ThiS [Paremcibacter congregatus]